MEMIAYELGRCLEQLHGGSPVIYKGEWVGHRPSQPGEGEPHGTEGSFKLGPCLGQVAAQVSPSGG
eukprot:11192206-Heterocapsa_arctica.AAC.1